MKLAWPLVVALSAMPVFAQDTSAKDAGAQGTGAQDTGVAMPVLGQYAGPAILSRGEAPSSMSAPKIDFRPFVDVAGIYSSGLSGLGTGSQGTSLGDISSEGVLISFGVSGLHSWKHTSVGVNYVGSITQYSAATYGNYDGQSLLLSATHQFSPHISLSLRESAALSSQPIASPGLPQTVTFDPSAAYNPTTDFYNNRTVFLSTQAALTFQKSARLSFSFSGQGNLTDRQSAALYSVTGGGANGDAQYRLSRRSTIGAAYGYMHFAYHGTFNATDIHTVSGTYALQLSRSMEVTGYGGFARAESKFLQGVPIDPALAALIGLTTGTVISHSILWHPTYNVRLSRSFQRGVAFVESGYSTTPGNGLFLTSTALTATAGYSYTGLRLWSLGVTGAYLRASSISNVVGSYGDYSGNLSASRRLGRAMSLTFSGSAMQYQSTSFTGYNRLTYSVTCGLAFSPGNIPLRVW